MANTDAYTTFSDLLGARFFSVELSSTEYAYPIATPPTPATPTYVEKLIRLKTGVFIGDGPISRVLLAYAPCDGTITFLAVKTALRLASPDALFNLSVGGVDVWEDEIDMLTMSVGDTYAEQAVGVAVSEGDALVLSLDSAARVTFVAMILTIEPS